jgi:hypothetical protein
VVESLVCIFAISRALSFALCLIRFSFKATSIMSDFIYIYALPAPSASIISLAVRVDFKYQVGTAVKTDDRS